MKKRLTMWRTLLFAAILIFVAYSAQAATIDQPINDGWWIQLQYAQPVAQSFTAEDVKVDWVGMYLKDANMHFNDLTIFMSLYSGNGIFTSDHLIMSEEISLGAFAGGAGYADMDVSSYDFVVGSSYTMALSNDTPRWGPLLSTINRYDGGMLYLFGNPYPNQESRFHVITNTASVPEPSNILLLGAGLAGLGILRRKFKN